LRSESGEEITEDEDKANAFNSYFSSVYTKEDLQDIPLFDKRAGSQLDSVEIKEGEVYDLLRKLVTDKSPGPDGIHPRILKECAKKLTLPLKSLLRNTLSEGRIPSQWKEATVSPVYKKGSRVDVSNYRPISLTSVCCKLMEKMLRKAPMRHMVSNGFLSDYQHGFVYGRLCTTQLLKVVDKWSRDPRSGRSNRYGIPGLCQGV